MQMLSPSDQCTEIVQVSGHGSYTRAADDDRAEHVFRHKAAQERRETQQRFRRAYVNAQLAQQWAAGQPWAELDASGVPWSLESSATAEDRWLEVCMHFPS